MLGEGGREGGREGRACKCLTRAPITGYWMCVVCGCDCGCILWLWWLMGWEGKGANDRWGLSVASERVSEVVMTGYGRVGLWCMS